MLNRQLLRLLFGEVEPDVMDACVTYLRISAYSYPALAVYNTGAAMYRSMGKTNVTMYLSLVSNGINVAGNAIGVFNAVCYPLSGALSNGLRAAIFWMRFVRGSWKKFNVI